MKHTISIALFSGIIIELIRYFLSIGPFFLNLFLFVCIIAMATYFILKRLGRSKFYIILLHFATFIIVIEAMDLIVLMVSEALFTTLELDKVVSVWWNTMFWRNMIVYVLIFGVVYFVIKVFLKAKENPHSA